MTTPVPTTTDTWSPQSWRTKPIVQDVTYPQEVADQDAGEVDPLAWKRKQGLHQVVEKLEKLPPLVSAVEVRWQTFVLRRRGVLERS